MPTPEWWPLQMLSHLARRVGRRGLSLLFVGLLAAVQAAGLALLPPALRQAPTYQQLLTLAPIPLWATAWSVSGLLCWVQAFMRQDRLAFAAATAMWWAYGIAHIVGTFTGVHPRGWFLGLVWLAFGGWLVAISTWPEEPRPSTARPVTLARPGDAVITADSDGIIRTWGGAAEKMFGWSAADAIGQPVDIIIPPYLREIHREAMRVARHRGALSTPGSRVLDTFGLHADGRTFAVQTTLGLVVTPGGTVFSAVIRRRSDPPGGGDG